MAGLSENLMLDQSEIEQIPIEIQEKVQSFISSKTTELDSLKSKHEKLRVNSEQQYFDVEKQLISCNNSLETERSQSKKIQEKLTELETKHAESLKKLQDLQESGDSFTTSKYEFQSRIQLLENEKRDLSIISNKRNKEIDRLNEELNGLYKKLSTANTEKCEAQATLSEQQADKVSWEFREKRLEKEKEQLEGQIEWFNQQLTEKTNLLSTVRTTKTNDLLEVQAKLDEKNEELLHLQAVVESMKKGAEEQDKRTNSLVEKLKDERENQVQVEEQFRQELVVQKRLIDLFKASSEDNDAKVLELTGAVEELRKLLKDASLSYSELETTKTQEINRLNAVIGEKDSHVAKLDQELKSANELIIAVKKGAMTLSQEAVETLSPSAAATSKLLKSGMSLTQIYNEYVQATDALSEEKDENKRLNSYLEQILQEIEEKAPLLKKQREDYETSLNNLDQMTTQLDTVMLECEKLRADADDMRRSFSRVQRDGARHQQTAKDLGTQVQYLLKEIEELRGGRVINEEMDLSSNNISSSSDAISEKLVTFRSIQDLQKQNQRLMEVARDLGEKKEREEIETTNEKTRELKEQLEFTMTELNNLKEARGRQSEMVESLVRQRDMYRVLMRNDGVSPEFPAVSPVTTSTPIRPQEERRSLSSSSPVIEKKLLEEAKKALTELRAEYAGYKKDRADNDKIQSETLEKMRQDVSTQRVSNAKLSTQLESATERYKIVQSNAAGFKKEIDLLQDRNHKSSATIMKHESALAHLKEELMTAKENVARWQVQIENLRKEKELVSNSEKRVTMELENLRRQQTSQSLLVKTLQTIQTNQEKAEFDMNARHKNKVDDLERELANLRRKLEYSSEEKLRQATAWEDIVKNVHMEIKMEKEKQAALREKAENAAIEVESAKEELKTCEQKLIAAEQKLEKLSQPGDDELSITETEVVKDLKNQRAQDQILVKNLRQQLGASKKHANQFKTISEGLEANMKEQAKTMKDVQDECENKIRDAAVAKEVLANRFEQLENDYQEVMKENNRLSNEGQSVYGDLRQQLATLRTELEEAISQKDAAVTSSKTAQEDCKKQAEIAAEAQSKYERELMLHAADVEASATIKKQVEDTSEHLQQSQEETILYEKQLGDAKASWAEQERIFQQEVKLLESRVEDLTNQNTVLHEQMEKLSSQVVRVQESARKDDRAMNVSFSEDDGKSANQLLEVIKFLRKQKDIAESKLAVIDSECNRVKQRFTHLEKNYNEANKALEEERERAQINAETTINQVELVRKVSNLNVLTDSNKLLRDERDQLFNNKQQLEAKVFRLETDIEPLQENLRKAQSQKDTMTIECDSLKMELSRWRNRASNLIEQSHKTDPEEQKRILQEKENLRKMLAQARDESAKQKADLNRVNASSTSLANEVSSLKQENSKTGQELSTVKKQIEERTKECEEKNTTINRLKQIGRKYKEQAEKVTKELAEVKKKVAVEETGKVNMASLQKTVSELTNTVTAKTASISALEAQLTDAQNASQAAEKRVEQAAARADLATARADQATARADQATARAEQASAEATTVKTLTETLSTKEQEMAQLQSNNSRLKAEVDGFEKRREEFEKKQTQSRAVLQNARNKMMTQKANLEKLEAENKHLKELQGSQEDTPEHVRLLRAQHESRVSTLEKELNDLKKSSSVEKEKALAETLELTSKVQQLQKQLENAQLKHSPPQQPVPARPAGSVAPSSTSTDPPKTANIKPMAPAASTSRQAPPMATHSSSSSAKVTASIRPMAISPTAANLPNTPTATVMPTTVSQHDSSSTNEALQQTSLPSTAAVSGRVQIVEPQVAGEWNPDTNNANENQTSDDTVEAMVAPNMVETVQVVNPTQATPQVSMPSTSSSLPGEGQHTLGVALGKRTREDDTFTPEEGESKRSRTSSQEHAIPTINVIDENQQVITQIQPHMATGSPLTRTGIATPTSAAMTRSFNVETGEETKEGDGMPEKASEETSHMQGQQRSGDDVIMVLSDEEDHEGKDENLEEVDEEDYEDDDDEDDDDNEDDEEEIAEGDDNDDVVIIDVDEQQQQQQQQHQQQIHQQVMGAGDAVVSEGGPHPPPAYQTHTERLTSAGRTQQFANFMLAGANVLEDDDCTVPSTPTLSQPRRADGFAEALNSPAVSRQFVFGSMGEGSNNPDLAQIESQRALGMDDTRMDLSQFDESSVGSAGGAKPLSKPNVGESMSIMEPISGGTMDPSDLYLTERTTQEEEGEEALLEGDGDPAEQEEEGGDAGMEPEEQQESDVQVSGEGVAKVDGSSDGTKTDSTAKPPIKKIVWDSPQSSSTSSSIAATSAPQGVQPSSIFEQQQQGQLQQRRAHGLRRGGPTRGRGQYWTQSQTRGALRGRGGFRGF